MTIFFFRERLFKIINLSTIDRCILQYHTTKNFICFFYVRFMNCEAKDCEQCS
ncbi:hypothetical protein CLOSTMETH_01035 [[Clostridium] methylpentosum DSM 5476]|uniref:Uncharacterized protein n=1 Tax=[Clostridium] methylpentosum DSM 5476 TaxID=537013 RepID=C0EB17_9FIRM|nr:hypothetical protein CLOSTMETH_01035 [[Clostridium] methylpentosum DSM 5476]